MDKFLRPYQFRPYPNKNYLFVLNLKKVCSCFRCRIIKYSFGFYLLIFKKNINFKNFMNQILRHENVRLFVASESDKWRES